MRGERTGRVVSPVEVDQHAAIYRLAGAQEAARTIGGVAAGGVAEHEELLLLRIAARQQAGLLAGQAEAPLAIGSAFFLVTEGGEVGDDAWLRPGTAARFGPRARG